MVKQKLKKVWRLPPCPDYDIEGTESWLEDMALEGLFLAENGFFGGVARFERQNPRPVRYRLAASPEVPSLLNDYDAPPEEQVELSAEEKPRYRMSRPAWRIGSISARKSCILTAEVVAGFFSRSSL